MVSGKRSRTEVGAVRKGEEVSQMSRDLKQVCGLRG